MRAHAPLGRLVGLAMMCAGLGTASLATPEVARAATADSPSAIAVAPDGMSYVGFSTGGKLVRIGSNGKLKGGLPLDQDEAVDGLYVTHAGDIWVDYETGFSLLGPAGGVQAHFDHQPSRSCDSRHPASRYGGITANDHRIYIANRCHDSMSVYKRNGDLVATVDLPGRPRGITYGNAQAGRPAFVYVAIPDEGRILAFKAGSVRSSSKPAKTYTLRRPSGGAKPEPAGLAVDKWGQLAVSDLANNALYMLDTNNGFSLYRTLGHPPHASRAAGRLNGPSAIAQHDQDGGGLAGNLFIADTNNDRVQRWDAHGYTFWARGVRPGAGGNGGDDGGGGGGGDGASGPPVNSAPPEITGTLAVGQLLACQNGTWTNRPTAYQYSWSRSGTAIPGANAQTYTVVAADAGASLTCTVRAGNSQGSDTATSEPVTIGGGGGGGGGPGSGYAPVNSRAPWISGTPAVGQALTCNPGDWSGVPTFSYLWRRNGTTVDGATLPTYVVSAADVGASLVCTVIADNGAGRGAASTQGVTVADSSPPTGPAPTLGGSGDVGTALVCDRGTWTGAGNTYAYAWQSDGNPIPDTAADRYVVLSQDVGHRLTCTVTARNGAGTKSLVSGATTVGGPSGHAPFPGAGPVITGTATTGQTLTCGVGTWTGDPTITYVVVWQRDGVTIGPGATYVLTSADRGAAIRCVVVASNGAGRGAARSDAVGGNACAGPVGVDVNGGASESASPAVQLSIRPPVGATKVLISNDAGMAGAVERPLSATCTYAWRMDSIPGLPLTWSVYVTFDAGPATTYSDSILLNEPAARLRLW